MENLGHWSCAQPTPVSLNVRLSLSVETIIVSVMICFDCSVQIKVLQQGLKLLANGGRLVYSTCSFNPIENEAVIATMLNLCEGIILTCFYIKRFVLNLLLLQLLSSCAVSGSVRLVDCSNELVDLKRNPGMKTWQVCIFICMDSSGLT